MNGRDRTDAIEAYLERGKAYRSGFVYFTSSVVYENFTDVCRKYPVRIDVEGWDNYVPNGVTLKGLDQIRRPELQMAAFEITKGFFNRIVKKLVAVHSSPPKGSTSGALPDDVDESVVEALEKSQAKGQGFVLDSKLRKALEDYAMATAKCYFKAQGYKWKDCSNTCPYDLRCSRGKEVLHVEVKGTQTNGTEIILTPREVEFARRHKGQMALFVVHSIQVGEANGRFALSGGKRRLLQPWDVDLGHLAPVSFKYALDRGLHLNPTKHGDYLLGTGNCPKKEAPA